MKRLLPLLLSAITAYSSFAQDGLNDPNDPYFINYAHATGITSSSPYRYRGIQTLTISDNLGHSLTLSDMGTGSHEIFADRTSSIFTTKAGATITTKGTPYTLGADMWSCSYLYIDFNNDKRFDVDQSLVKANNDLVTYNGYGLSYSNGDTQPDNKNYSVGECYNLPEFQLPANMPVGYYRVRYKNDWNSTHPYGRTNNTLFDSQSQNNGIFEANGVIIDFTLRIVDNDSEITDPDPNPTPNPDPTPDPTPDPIASELNDPNDPYFVNYAHVDGNVDGDGDGVYNFNHRGLDSLIVADNYDNRLVVEDFGKRYHEVFADLTDDIFTTKVGAIIKIRGIPYPAAYAANWTCSYFYIDFDNDKRFDVDQSIEDANNDLVVYNGYGLKNLHYSGTVGLFDTRPDSSSVKLDGTRDWYDGWCGDTYSLPEFQLPIDMKPGQYRVRYKNDWNSTHPYGRTDETLYGQQCEGNGIMRIGGMIIDFTINVKKNDELLALEDIGEDGNQSVDFSQPYDVYNMQGVRISDSLKGIMTGLYVVRQGSVAVKIAVK